MALPRRKAIRLKSYDYSQPGYYFVTICTQGKKHVFGRIVGADSISARPDFLSAQPQMVLSDAGKLVERALVDVQGEYPGVVIHERVTMPNHVHLVIQIRQEKGGEDKRPSLPEVVQSFKRKTTLLYIDGVKRRMFEPFERRLWQRGYYEHVIRSEAELNQIRQYIADNPLKWADDEYYS